MAVKDVLAGFTKLGQGQHLHNPHKPIGASEGTLAANLKIQPDLIILCAWMFASPRHVAKYFEQYQITYPNAKILLLQNDMSNMTWRPDSMQIQRLKPSATAIQDTLKTSAGANGGKGENPTILLHIFSNGGLHSAVQLAQAYRELIAASSPESRSGLPAELPLTAVVMDSCPGKLDFFAGVEVAMSSIPRNQTFKRLLAIPFAYAIVAGIMGMRELGITEDVGSKIWNHPNDPTGPFLTTLEKGVLGNGSDGLVTNEAPRRILPRTYIYSKRDELVRDRDVIAHAAEARNACALAGMGPDKTRDAEDKIRLEEFVGSMHVNHLSIDTERYWRLVRETFERGVET